MRQKKPEQNAVYLLRQDKTGHSAPATLVFGLAHEQLPGLDIRCGQLTTALVCVPDRKWTRKVSYYADSSAAS